MSEFLREADPDTAMRVVYSPDDPPIHQHTVWTGDFMAMAKHDVACPVCFDAPAVLERNVTPGHWRQEFQPCRRCQANGWRIVKLPRWLQWMFRR